MNTEYLSLSIYILLVNFFLKIMFLFLKEYLMLTKHVIPIYLIQNTVKNINIVKTFILKALYIFWWQINFQQSLLQSSVSHDPSEIILIWKISVLVNLHYKIIKIVGHFILRSNSCY